MHCSKEVQPPGIIILLRGQALRKWVCCEFWYRFENRVRNVRFAIGRKDSLCIWVLDSGDRRQSFRHANGTREQSYPELTYSNLTKTQTVYTTNHRTF
jgi:hypothetical protein